MLSDKDRIKIGREIIPCNFGGKDYYIAPGPNAFKAWDDCFNGPTIGDIGLGREELAKAKAESRKRMTNPKGEMLLAPEISNPWYSPMFMKMFK